VIYGYTYASGNNYRYPLCGSKIKAVKGVKRHKPIIEGNEKSKTKSIGISEKRFSLCREKRKKVQRQSGKSENKGIVAPELHRIYYSGGKTGYRRMLFNKLS
jgi:hypothetical protein